MALKGPMPAIKIFENNQTIMENSINILRHPTPGDIVKKPYISGGEHDPYDFERHYLDKWSHDHNWSITLPWEYERRAWLYAYYSSLYYLAVNYYLTSVPIPNVDARLGELWSYEVRLYLGEMEVGNRDSSYPYKQFLFLINQAVDEKVDPDILELQKAVAAIGGGISEGPDKKYTLDEYRDLNWNVWKQATADLLTEYKEKVYQRIYNYNKQKQQEFHNYIQKTQHDAYMKQQHYPHIYEPDENIPDINWDKARYEWQMKSRYPHKTHKYDGPNIDWDSVAKALAEKEKQKEEDALRKVQESTPPPHEPHGGGPGLTYPGSRYIGPGNLIPYGPPTDDIDNAAALHDIRYETMISHLHWPYIYDQSDDYLIEDIKNAEKNYTFLGNLIIAIMYFKKKVGKPIIDALEKVWPPEPIENLPSFQQIKQQLDQIIQHSESTTPISSHSSNLLPDASSQTSETKKSKETSPEKTEKELTSPKPIQTPPTSPKKDTPDTPQKPPTKKIKEEPETPQKKDMSTGQTATDQRGNHAGIDSHMASADAPTIVQGGGGGGKPTCGKVWWGGTEWKDNHVTTFSTRRCVLKPYPDNYYSQRSMDNIPGIVIVTPWYYFDFNCMSCHWSPAQYQTLIETQDEIRPVSMKMMIHHLVFKDVTTGSDSQTAIQDVSSGAILLHRDGDYKFPYPMGGGQLTHPGHMPGSFYELPRYSYRTLAKVDPVSAHAQTQSGSHASTVHLHYSPTQDTELLLVEDQPSKMLFTGDCYEFNYDFPALPFAKLTQYPWNPRRQDNPLAEQKFLTMTNILEADVFAPHGGTKLVPLPFSSKMRPAQWLPGPKFKQGDYAVIKPEGAGGTQHWFKQKTTKDTPIRTVRATDIVTGGDNNWETLQPGPDTVSNIVKKPEGDIIVTANGLAVIIPDDINQHHNQSSRQADGYVKLPILPLRGHNGPDDPQQIRHQNITDHTYQEVTFARYPGATWERKSLHYETELWTKIPNTDFVDMPQDSPLTQWAMKNPPDLILIRMLQTLGPPENNLDTGSKQSNTVLNQYCQFLVSYSITWEIRPRSKQTPRWNPIPPPQLPIRNDGKPIYVMNIETPEKHYGGVYLTPDEVWVAKQRVRAHR
nr:structural protein [Sika deer copiparvovirus]